MSNRERDRNGRFINNIKENVENAYNGIALLMRSIPIMIIIMFLLNYFKAWDTLKNYAHLAINVGNPNCQLQCADQAV